MTMPIHVIRLATPARIRAVAAVLVALAVGAAVVVQARIARSSAVDDFNPQPDPPRFGFGLTGITRGQTARLSVANLGLTAPPEPDIPPPCRVTVGFVDINGAPLVNDDGQPVRRSFTIEAGHAAFVQINGDAFVGRAGDVSTNGSVLRVNVRPVFVDRWVEDFLNGRMARKDGATPPDPCHASFEIIDNATARTLVFSPAVKIQ